jgi:HrpA-like RNA helicase
MGPKKSSKKKPDSRGFNTSSVLAVKQPPAEIEKITEQIHAVEESKAMPSLAEEDIVTEHSRRVCTEIINIQRYGIGNIYRGALFPPLTIDIQCQFGFHSKDVLSLLLDFAKLTPITLPILWKLPLWTYMRSHRVLHALVGAGFENSVACDAVVQLRGWDDRACAEWIILNYPEKLPVDWCDQDLLSSDLSGAIVAPGDAGVADAVATSVIVKSLSKKERVDMLKSNQEQEAAIFKRKQHVRQLILDIQREHDQSAMPDYSKGVIAEPPSPTSRYEELTIYQTSLRAAMKDLTVKKEKQLVKAKCEQLAEEITSLRPLVDFDRLKKIRSGGTVDIGKPEDANGVDADADADADADGAGAGAGKDVSDGSELVNALQELTIEPTGAMKGMSEEEEEEGAIFGLFGDTDEDATPSTTAAAANTSTTPSVQRRVFEYDKSKTHSSPQKLLSDVIQDVKRFTTVLAGPRNCIERLEIGPLSSTSAKQIGYARGSVISAQPEMLSVDQEGARQLACLNLLLLATCEAKREGVAKKMSSNVRAVWNEWIESEVRRKKQEVEDLAESRVRACELSVEKWEEDKEKKGGPKGGGGAKSSNEGSEGGDGQEKNKKDKDKAYTSHRGLTRREAGREIRSRSSAGKLTYEPMRSELPICAHADEVVGLIESHDVSIVCGETGSGKSTQVPQLLLRACATSGDSSCDSDDSSDGDEVIRIIVTEPRRVAAVSVSSRVGEELGDTSTATALVGYTVRLESKTGPRCVIEYVTIGVLLRRIQASNGAILESYSHVIVDEVHERSVDSDLLLLLLKQYRQDMCGTTKTSTNISSGHSVKAFPRIVLMSATADAEAIAAYWTSVTSSIATTRISGRTFPVTALFLEDAIEDTGYGSAADANGGSSGSSGNNGGLRKDEWEEASTAVSSEEDVLLEGTTGMASGAPSTANYSTRTIDVMDNFYLNSIPYDLITHIVHYELIVSSSTGRSGHGAVLIFVPGMEEIRRVIGMLQGHRELSRVCVPLPMHSSLSFEELQRAFRRVEFGKRKVIVSTNICETGVTIEDVDLVIDTGFVKSVEWNEVTELSRLRMHYCSVAESMQRRGRAGRVRAGRCYHLFPQCIFRASSQPQQNPYAFSMKARPDPEMARAPLTSPILNLIDQGFPPSLLLCAVGDTVKIAKLRNALNTLLELGAITAAAAPPVVLCISEPEVEKEKEGEVEVEVEAGQDKSAPGGGISSSSEESSLCDMKYSPTALGRMLAVLPCDPRSGKILLAARKLGCLPSAAVYVASLDCKNVFMRKDFSDSFFRDKFMKKSESDAIAIVNAFSEWLGSASKHRWSRENGIVMAAMSQLDGIAKDLTRSLEQFDKNSTHNKKSTSVLGGGSAYCNTCKYNVGMHTCQVAGTSEALHAAIACGMGNNVSYRASPPESAKITYMTGARKTGAYCTIGRASLVSDPGEWIIYSGKMANDSGRQSVSNVCAVDVSTVLLFSPWTKYYICDGTIIVGGGIGVKCKPQSLVALRRLKVAWEYALCHDTTAAAVDSRTGGSSVVDSQEVMMRAIGLILDLSKQ